jgi:hypothetical protein
MKKILVLLFVLSISVTFAGCGGSSSGGGGGGGGGGVVLTADDFPNVGVCATANVDLTAQTFKDAIAAATGVALFHKPYSTDAVIPFICGKQGVWDPSEADAFDTVSSIDITDLIVDILGGALGQVFICNDGFTFAGTNFGFHSATTFRGELFFQTNDPSSFRVRVRFTVTGADADATLASLNLTTADITLTDGSGNVLTSVADVLTLFAADPTNVTVNVVSNGTTHITATGGVICAETQ